MQSEKDGNESNNRVKDGKRIFMALNQNMKGCGWGKRGRYAAMWGAKERLWVGLTPPLAFGLGALLCEPYIRFYDAPPMPTSGGGYSCRPLAATLLRKGLPAWRLFLGATPPDPHMCLMWKLFKSWLLRFYLLRASEPLRDRVELIAFEHFNEQEEKLR